MRKHRYVSAGIFRVCLAALHDPVSQHGFQTAVGAVVAGKQYERVFREAQFVQVIDQASHQVIRVFDHIGEVCAIILEFGFFADR